MNLRAEEGCSERPLRVGGWWLKALQALLGTAEASGFWSDSRRGGAAFSTSPTGWGSKLDLNGFKEIKKGTLWTSGQLGVVEPSFEASTLVQMQSTSR